MGFFKKQKNKKTHREWIALIKEFKEQTGRFPKKSEYYKKQTIGVAYNYLKGEQAKGNLLKSEINELENLGIQWIVKQKTSAEWVELILLFHKKYRRPPHKTENFNGEHIGTACNTLRLKKRADKLASELIKKLNKIDFIWDANIKTDEEWVEMLIYKLKHNVLSLNTLRHQRAEARIRGKRAQNKLKRSLIRKLDKAGFDWNPAGDIKTLAKKRLKALKEFKKKYDRLPEPHEQYKKENVGKHISYFKKSRLKGALKKDIESELNNMGFVWHERMPRKKRGKNSQWVKLIEQFYNEYAHFPKNNEVFKCENVGRGALYLRQRYREGKLNADIVGQLKRINFHWKTPARNVLMYNWAIMLKEFYAEKERMPRKNERFMGINLGNVFEQLNVYKPSSLPQKVINILRQTNFVVNPLRKIKTPHEIMDMLKEFKTLYNRKPRGSEYYQEYSLGRGYWYLKQQFLAKNLPESVLVDFEKFEK